MCESLVDLREALGRYASSFDAAVLSGPQASLVVEVASAMERMAAVLVGLAGARVAETGAWKSSGERSAAHHLARVRGSSVTSAAEALESAKRLETLPSVGAAARAGKLSGAQVAAVAAAASADPSSESRLVGTAASVSLAELRSECARTTAAAPSVDLEERRKRIHASRFLRAYTGPDGAWNLHLRENPEVGARVMAAVEAERDRRFADARKNGEREHPDAYAADALVALVTGEAKSSGGGTKVLVRVDLEALLRGYPTEGEVCEIAGYGPVAVSAVRDLIDSGDPFLVAIATRGEAVVGVAHLGRRPRAAPRSALQWLYPTCAVEGCATVARLEYDHRVDWAQSHRTAFDYLDRLCPHHHRLKTRENWALVPGRGKRAFVAPEDPRHPGVTGRAPERRATGPPSAA